MSAVGCLLFGQSKVASWVQYHTTAQCTFAAALPASSHSASPARRGMAAKSHSGLPFRPSRPTEHSLAGTCQRPSDHMQSVRVDLAPGQHTIHRPSWLRNSRYFDVPLYAELLAFLETWQVLGCPYMSPWAATYIQNVQSDDSHRDEGRYALQRHPP